MEWYLKVWREFGNFEGRARRTEYWMFVLFNLIATFLLMSIGYFSTIFYYLYLLYCVAVFLPSLAVLVRRLHDTNRSGWWFLLVFIPLIGAIVLLVWLCTEGDHKSNQYGPNPKAEGGGRINDDGLLDSDLV